MTIDKSCTLCVSGGFLVLDRRLLKVVSGIGGGVLFLAELSLCRCVAVDRLVLLRRLAGSISATVGLLLGLFCLKTVDFLLCLGDVLWIVLAMLVLLSGW